MVNNDPYLSMWSMITAFITGILLLLACVLAEPHKCCAHFMTQFFVEQSESSLTSGSNQSAAEDSKQLILLGLASVSIAFHDATYGWPGQ